MKQVFNFLALFRRERRPGDLVFAVGFFLFAVLVALVLPQQAKFLPDKALITQPGFWPAVGVAMMLLFGGVHMIATLNAPRLPGRLREVLVWGRSLEFVGWFVVYVLSVPRIGYLPATVALAVLLGVRLGYRTRRALLAAVLFAVAVVLIFRTGLHVRLPAGALYSYLPDAIRSFAMTNF
ncbi:tripartite tricarboxylate transporter TctB family protein [Phaeobacter sp. HF9A]|uniref:tripartite tricarboxylate transporter TctB family protein n=1 Tax=Phaeobacter sp. HF9A TaxID=2721561 RepID=UPI00143042C1|nr:tripartite tricarboxylate transporter TctB family protein [Phaeobacter sp. HF9A]NIZ12123.1 tripartite tricarboxylate transporter TctB family protein [Phaeobacter sp. HF9A]